LHGIAQSYKPLRFLPFTFNNEKPILFWLLSKILNWENGDVA